MRAMGWRDRYLVLLGAIGLLTGCGNAYQHLTMGEWREVGQAEAPMAPAKDAFVVTTTLDPGEGPPVQAGDLVKALVTVTKVSKGRGGPATRAICLLRRCGSGRSVNQRGSRRRAAISGRSA